ncbi:hypothetical protein [Streptomyces mirabilis]|uniref:hypothetical protein n=1 Tax=Streptomyces mirabilis TaxID=68239 RepID=UPI00131A7D5B|nr:hypothetical protein [Streptomyces mirabilis]MCX4418744.1 hypothetical protein [Streptomyces mirabilis]
MFPSEQPTAPAQGGSQFGVLLGDEPDVHSALGQLRPEATVEHDTMTAVDDQQAGRCEAWRRHGARFQQT